MRILLSIFYLIFICSSLFSQQQANSFNKLFICTFLPESSSIPKENTGLFNSKLSQITNAYGLGGNSDCNSRFYITGTFNVISKEITSTAPSNVILNAIVTFTIIDKIDGVQYAFLSISISGIGQSEVKAYNSAISKIAPLDKQFDGFIQSAKNNIKNYYASNCESIMKNANNLSVQGQYNEAIFELTKIPDISSECYASSLALIEKIYQQKVDKECLLIMRNARTIWASSPGSESARQVAELVAKISPFSSCEPDLTLLLSEIKNKLTEDQNKAFGLKIKKYNDAIELKREALRIDEEDRKRQAAIKRAEIKSEYAQKKAELESEGGVINKIKKLKLILWGENESSYLKEKGKTAPSN